MVRFELDRPRTKPWTPVYDVEAGSSSKIEIEGGGGTWTFDYSDGPYLRLGMRVHPAVNTLYRSCFMLYPAMQPSYARPCIVSCPCIMPKSHQCIELSSLNAGIIHELVNHDSPKPHRHAASFVADIVSSDFEFVFLNMP